MMDTATIDGHRCPRCGGTGKTPAPDFPRGHRPIACVLCGQSGIIDDEKMERVRFGERVRASRIASGVTLRKFAAKCGCSTVVISLIEQGIVNAPESVRAAIAKEADRG